MGNVDNTQFIHCLLGDNISEHWNFEGIAPSGERRCPSDWLNLVNYLTIFTTTIN